MALEQPIRRYATASQTWTSFAAPCSHYVYEALRFRPMLPLLIRDTPRETVIAYGTKDARIVRAGTESTCAATGSHVRSRGIPPTRNALTYRDRSNATSIFGFRAAALLWTIHRRNRPATEIFRSLLVFPSLSRAAGHEGEILPLMDRWRPKASSLTVSELIILTRGNSSG